MSPTTSLYSAHLAQKARMVDFHGWQVPLDYGSQIEEHHQVRKDAGLFDVSHMNIVDLSGKDSPLLLQKLLANNIDKLSRPGMALYSCMCNEQGGIIDDLIAYYRGDTRYRLVFNSSTCTQVLQWLKEKSLRLEVNFDKPTDVAMLAIQGPKAIPKVLSLFSQATATKIGKMPAFQSIEQDNWFFSRTGYTGEDGLEIILPNNEVHNFWKTLLEQGIKPCGLAARDTLRLEAGLLLNGQDMNETTSPLEVGLEWTIDWQSKHSFIGKQTLLLQKNQGNRIRLIGLILQEPGIMRAKQILINNNQSVGVITSGGYSPTLNQSIALAQVSIDPLEQLFVEIRGKKLAAKVVKPRFVKWGKSIN